MQTFDCARVTLGRACAPEALSINRIALLAICTLIVRPGARVDFRIIVCIFSSAYTFLYDYRFNIAEIGAMSRDIPHEARELVKRMHADPMVNVSADWKVKCSPSSCVRAISEYW